MPPARSCAPSRFAPCAGNRARAPPSSVRRTRSTKRRNEWIMASVKKLKIAVVGAGMGGLSSAAALRKLGIDVDIYEQAESFSRIGAGIHVAANAVKALYGLGLSEQTLREKAFMPIADYHREYNNGKLNGELTHNV